MAQISDKMIQNINEQSARELYNMNLYRYIASWFSNLGLDNLANHFNKQADDEKSHSQKFQDYLDKRIGANYKSLQVDEVNVKIDTIQDIGELYQNQEIGTTENIENLVMLAESDKDYLTRQFLDWYLEEQINEENEAFIFNQQVKLLNTDMASLVIFDKEFEEN